MKTTFDKVEKVTKATITLEFESAEEILTFKNILRMATNVTYQEFRDKSTLEKNMLQSLDHLIHKYL